MRDGRSLAAVGHPEPGQDVLLTWTLPAALIPALIGATAILLAIGYSLAALTITSTVLTRRDVTS